MKKLLAFSATLGLMTGVASAALQLDWGSVGASSVVDLDDDQNSAGQAPDIRQVSYVQQGGSYYFLMVTDAAPSAATFAEGYMLNFDFQPGGANAANSYYTAAGLTGVDLMIDAHYFQDFKISNHWHPYDAGQPPLFGTANGLAAPYNIVYNTQTIGGQFYQEWQVATSLLPANTGVTLYGSTLNPSSESKVTYDITSGLNFTTVPEPTSMALLALGAAALGLRRKVRT